MTAYDTVGTHFLVSVVGPGSSSSPQDFEEFCVTSIDPVGETRATIDVTTLCSEAREFRLALQEGQEIAVEGFYDPAITAQIRLRNYLRNGDPLTFKIQFSTTPADEATFDALVMEWSTGAAVDGVYPLRLRLKPTGPILWASG